MTNLATAQTDQPLGVFKAFSLPGMFETGDLSVDEKARLLAATTIERFQKGDTIVAEHCTLTRVYTLRTGWWSASIAGQVVMLLAPNQTYGGLADDRVCEVTVTALCRSSAWTFERAPVLEVLLSHPLVLLAAVERTIRAIRSCQALIGTRRADPALRLASLLWSISPLETDGLRWVPSPLTQKVLASCMSLSPALTAQHWQSLVAAGYLVRAGTRWKVGTSMYALVREAGLPANLPVTPRTAVSR